MGVPDARADLLSIGAVTAHRLAEVEIPTPEDQETVGPMEAYRRLKERFPRETTLVGLYAPMGRSSIGTGTTCHTRKWSD